MQDLVGFPIKVKLGDASGTCIMHVTTCSSELLSVRDDHRVHGIWSAWSVVCAPLPHQQVLLQQSRCHRGRHEGA